MSFGKWKLIDGVWVSTSQHSTQSAPQSRGITPGQAPGYRILHGIAQRKKDNLRKYDKPSEEQIAKLMQEDEAAIKAQNDVTPVVKETKQDIASGKIKIHPGVLHNLNGKYYEKVVPTSNVTDDRGVIHIIPRDKAIEKGVDPGYKTPEELYERMKRDMPQEEIIQASIGKTEAGNLPAIEEKDLIESSLQAVKTNRGAFRGRTIA